MDLSAAAEANASSGWLEGWVGGLIAAAITLAFTAWWEARQHRRRQLDDRVLALARVADKCWFRMHAAPRPDTAEIDALGSDLAIAHVNVMMLARRRASPFTPRVLAHVRNGLDKTLASVFVEVERTMTGARSDGSIKDAARAVMGYKRAAKAWIENPWSFAWGKDQATVFLTPTPDPDEAAPL